MKKVIVQILLLAAIKLQITSTKQTTAIYQNYWDPRYNGNSRQYEDHSMFNPFLRANGDDSYEINRTKLLEQELKDFVGGNIELNEDETKVNHIFMKLKKEDIKRWFSTPKIKNVNYYYSKYMDLIQTSKLFRFIKKMPKGAALHVNSKFVMDANYTAALMDDKNLFACYSDDDSYEDISDIKFSNKYLDKNRIYCNHNKRSYWHRMKSLKSLYDPIVWRDLYTQVTVPDETSRDQRKVEQLRKLFTLISKEQEANVKTEGGCHVDTNALWQRFEKISSFLTVLINYRPIRERFIYDTLKKLYDDNIMYAELRVNVRSLYQLHELNGTKHEPLYLVKLYDETTKRFIEDHPEFVGIKLIVSKNLATTKEEIIKAISLAKNIKKEVPDIFAGFDLIGQGAKVRQTNKLKDFLKANIDMNFYYHSGETRWHGTESGRNIIDAILLGCKRIGHEYELVLHPNFMNTIKKEDIAVEVNALSNVALNIAGIRNHPLGTFLALKLPVVLSSDDPGAWGAEPLSHDFYVTFVALAHENYDLKLLKQLAINSIKYSALENTERNKLYTVFKRRWSHFIQEVIEQYEKEEDYVDYSYSDCKGCYK